EATEPAGRIDAAIVEGLSTAAARVVASLDKADNVNVYDRPAMVYRQIQQAKSHMIDAGDDYDPLPAFLRSLARQNSRSRVCCQIDTLNRSFTSLFVVRISYKKLSHLVPVLGCDGTFMSHSRYKGVCALLTGKDGDWKNIPAVISFVLQKSLITSIVFFANCALGSSVTFKFVSASVDSTSTHNSVLFIYFSTLSTICRTVERNIKSVRTYGFRLQATTNQRHAIEGEKNALLVSGVRDKSVYGALITICRRAVEKLAQKKATASKWISQSETITSRAMNIFSKQLGLAGRYRVRKSTDSIFYAEPVRKGMIIEEDTINDPFDGADSPQQNGCVTEYKGQNVYS
ncbi:hypothetical protein GN958_ATG02188, partial [Phytophthora infestans]